jgi:hypothetical protein
MPPPTEPALNERVVLALEEIAEQMKISNSHLDTIADAMDALAQCTAPRPDDEPERVFNMTTFDAEEPTR